MKDPRVFVYSDQCYKILTLCYGILVSQNPASDLCEFRGVFSYLSERVPSFQLFNYYLCEVIKLHIHYFNFPCSILFWSPYLVWMWCDNHCGGILG